MRPCNRLALVVFSLASSTTVALAQPAGDTSAPPDEEGKKPPEQPGRGDFDAGGQVRLPSGPDDMGAYATFNWIALDLKGTYYVFDTVTVNGNIPLAVKHPDIVGGIEPKMIGGMTVTLDARLPTMNVPMAPKAKDTVVALLLTGAYMREGAMLLSEKDFPMFIGDFKPGFAGALSMRVKLSSVIDLSLAPAWVYQSGTMESATAVQLPTSTIIKLGETLKVSADLGLFTGDDYSFKGSNGGRIAAGGAIDLKIGPIITHAGAGVASLLSGGMYPTISDSVYIDLNVKYAK